MRKVDGSASSIKPIISHSSLEHFEERIPVSNILDEIK